MQQKYIMYLSPLQPGIARSIISNANRSNGQMAGNSCSRLQEICCVYFTNEQTSHLIFSGAHSLVSSAPIICFRSYTIASGLAQPSILCHSVAVALIGLQAIRLSQYLFEVKNVKQVKSRVFVGFLCISAQWPPSRFAQQTVLPVASQYSIFRPKSKWMSLAVALNSATIFIKKVSTSAIQDSFISFFPVGVLTVIITILQACIISKFPSVIR